jgi:hypothetical protein
MARSFLLLNSAFTPSFSRARTTGMACRAKSKGCLRRWGR